MALMYGQGATYDAIEGRFRRFRRVADDLRAEAESRGIDLSSSTPRTPRGARGRPAGTPSSTASKGNKGSSKKGGGYDGDGDGVPDTPTKSKSKSTGRIKVQASASDVIALDDSDSEMVKDKAVSPVAPAKMEDIPVTPTTHRVRVACSPPPGTPTPTFQRIVHEDLAVGSVSPVKRTIESGFLSEPPATRVKIEEKAMHSAAGMDDGLRLGTVVAADEYEDEDIA